MTEADRKEIGAFLKEIALEFRSIALEVDRDPACIANYLDMEGVRSLAYLCVPEPYNKFPVRTRAGNTYDFLTCAERVLSMEMFGYGDVGVMLACPGPSLSGIVLQELGSESQKERFFGRIASEPTWTFFGLSEKKRGSDAMSMTTRFQRDKATGVGTLNGEKWFVGNGTRGQIGLVFARYAPGPLGIDILLIDPTRPGFSPTPLPTVGLRGALLSQLKFEDYPIEKGDIVGMHRKPSARGLWGALKTFNRMRPGVAALALGTACAVIDYVEEHRPRSRNRDLLWAGFRTEANATRALIRRAAELIDQNPANGSLSSAAKARAVRLAEEVTEQACRTLGPGSMLEHPFIEKWYRDARGFEYMEGTTAIQQLTVFQSWSHGKLDHVPAL